MDRLDGMQAFVAVAETGSFSAAGARLGIARALVSKRVAALEAQLGVRLLNRTTRRVALTGPGTEFVARCQRILLELEEATSAVTSMQIEPQGRLKISAPMSLGVRHLAPLLPQFTRANPKVAVELVLNDRFVDLVEEGFDLCLRVGALADSSLVARKLSTVRRVLCASPDYLRRHGTPESAADLAGGRALHYGYQASGTRWQLKGPHGPVTVELPCALSANNGDVLLEAAIAGEGIAFLPTFIAGDALRDGRVVELLPAMAPDALGLYAIWVGARLMATKIRRFVDFAATRFTDPPSWDRGLAQQETDRP